MCKIYVAEYHHQILYLWRKQDASNLRILHLDFHCDMRGLFIDRRRQRAFGIPDFVSPIAEQGNFLTHSILEGRVSGIRWVHDEPGGRRYDVGTVKYETDLTAAPFRILNAVMGRRGIPIDYKEISYSEWTGSEGGEVLDIDWDFFACKEYPAETIKDRVDSFLEKRFPIIPEQVYVCYSPDYCHPSGAQFQDFIKELSGIFKAEVVELEPAGATPAARPLYKRFMSGPLLRLARFIYHRACLGLRKRGIY